MNTAPPLTPPHQGRLMSKRNSFADLLAVAEAVAQARPALGLGVAPGPAATATVHHPRLSGAPRHAPQAAYRRHPWVGGQQLTSASRIAVWGAAEGVCWGAGGPCSVVGSSREGGGVWRTVKWILDPKPFPCSTLVNPKSESDKSDQ